MVLGEGKNDWKIFELNLKILETYGQILGKYWKVAVICFGGGDGQQSMKQETMHSSSALKLELACFDWPFSVEVIWL